MTGVLSFTVLGQQQIARGLSRFTQGIKDYRPAWDKLHADFLRIEKEQFDTQGSRGGAPWAPLKPTYAAWKEAWFPGLPILQLTGRMYADLTGGTGLAVEKTPLMLRMAPRGTYPRYHQTGTRHMPPRPVVALTETDKLNWIKVIHNYVYDKAKEARLL